MAKEISIKKPHQKVLVELRNDIMLWLHKDEGYGPTEIGFIMNRPKQTVSHVLLTRQSRKPIRKN